MLCVITTLLNNYYNQGDTRKYACAPIIRDAKLHLCPYRLRN